jgi:undecaprenyl-diphosphatase
MVRINLASLPPWLRKASSAAEARLLATVALVAGGIWALLSLGGEVREGETGTLDRRIIECLRVPGHPHIPIGPRWLQDVMRDITALGGTTMVILATTLVVVTLVFHGNRRRAAVLAAVMVCAQGCDEILKGLYNRPRPDFAPVGTYVYAQSFPSGHSTASAALWLSLAMLAASFEPGRREKVFWFVVAGILIFGVGASRVFLGVHWPTDVLAGWMLGACWALAGWLTWRSRWVSPLGPRGAPSSPVDSPKV